MSEASAALSEYGTPAGFPTLDELRLAPAVDALGLVDGGFLDRTSQSPVRWAPRAKRVGDVVVASVMLVLLCPLVALIALLVVVTSGRPVVFRQRRLGQHGREFTLFKFRTMWGDPEVLGECDAEWALGAGADVDPPVTRDRHTTVGRYLRKLYLDEIPQLVNVLRGEMSIVGPRPERVAYAHLFESRVPGYVDRHRVKPGLTGLAQVQGLRGETSLAHRVREDNTYIEQLSFWTDVRILARTFRVLGTSVREAAQRQLV